MSLLTEIMTCVDLKDEFILKCIKDWEVGNLDVETFFCLVHAHERRFNLRALLKKEDD